MSQNIASSAEEENKTEIKTQAKLVDKTKENLDFDREFKFLYEKYAPMVFRRCRMLVKDEAESWDLTQNIFFNILEKRELPEDKDLSSYFYMIASRLSLNKIRDRGRQAQVGIDPKIFEILEECEQDNRSEQKILLEQISENESEETKTMAVMHVVEKRSYDEIAEIFQMSVSGIRKRLREYYQRVRLNHSLTGVL